MTIKDRINEEMKTAMKSGAKQRLSVLRMLRSKMQEAEIQGRASHGADYSLEDAVATEVVSRYAKQRREVIEACRQVGRDDMVAKEEAELKIVQEYLPEQMSEGEIRNIVKEAIAESGASSLKDIGAVMKLVMPQLKGRADGKLVNSIVKQSLGGTPGG